MTQNKKKHSLSLAQKLNPLIGRLVPLVAVAAANCINIPMMRRSELANGIALVDEHQKPLGVQSKKAATEGISSVVVSRITMAMPGMGECFDGRGNGRRVCDAVT